MEGDEGKWEPKGRFTKVKDIDGNWCVIDSINLLVHKSNCPSRLLGLEEDPSPRFVNAWFRSLNDYEQRLSHV